MPDKKDILDLYFMPARRDLIEIAAYLDRLERHSGETDFRAQAFEKALQAMLDAKPGKKAAAVLESLSDHTVEPAEKSNMKAAWGAPQNS